MNITSVKKIIIIFIGIPITKTLLATLFSENLIDRAGFTHRQIWYSSEVFVSDDLFFPGQIV